MIFKSIYLWLFSMLHVSIFSRIRNRNQSNCNNGKGANCDESVRLNSRGVNLKQFHPEASINSTGFFYDATPRLITGMNFNFANAGQHHHYRCVVKLDIVSLRFKWALSKNCMRKCLHKLHAWTSV